MDRFESELKEFRREKDQFFKTEADSPILLEHRSTLEGLVYFPTDRRYHVLVRLERFERPVPVLVWTSTGEQQSYMKYGSLEFELMGNSFV